jgi:hypothetical protein
VVVSNIGGDLSKWNALLARAYGLHDAHVKVGVLKAKGGGQAIPGASITIVDLAAIHEFGSPEAGVPERSYIRSTFRNAVWLPSLQAQLARKVVTGGMSPRQALGILGAKSVAEVRKTITDRKTEGPEPQENAQSTIDRKGSDVPLVDTGRLLQSIAYEVVA